MQTPFGIRVSAVAWNGNTPLPTLQSYAAATTPNSVWLLIGGATMGRHGLQNSGQTPASNQNFPQNQLNYRIWVIDPVKQKVYSRAIAEIAPGLVSSLAVISPQFTQDGDHLYIVGGYGYTPDGQRMVTQPTFTVVDVAATISAVVSGTPIGTHIRQAKPDAFLSVTGGQLAISNGRFVLAFGQNFQGFYTPQTNGVYTYQVCTFQMEDNGSSVVLTNPRAYGSAGTNPDFRRRDFTMAPAIRPDGTSGYTVFGGVFTTNTGPWRTPIYIDPSGAGFTVSDDATGFQQYMNQYDSAVLPVWSVKARTMDTVLFGGIGEGTYDPMSGFRLNSDIPFVAEVTDVQRAGNGSTRALLLVAPDAGGSDALLVMPGLLGASAHLFPAAGTAGWFRNGIVYLDEIRQPSTVGYIFGGIKATQASNGPTSATNTLLRVEILPSPARALLETFTQ